MARPVAQYVSAEYMGRLVSRAEGWLSLRAWGVELSPALCCIRPPRGETALGRAIYARTLDGGMGVLVPDTVVVYCTGDLVVDICTVFHELAHLAARGHEHREEWRRKYADAVAEVTGHQIPVEGAELCTWTGRVWSDAMRGGDSPELIKLWIDAAAEDAIRSWLWWGGERERE